MSLINELVKGEPGLMHADKGNEVIKKLNLLDTMQILLGTCSAPSIQVTDSNIVITLPTIRSVVCYEKDDGTYIKKTALVVGVIEGEVP